MIGATRDDPRGGVTAPWPGPGHEPAVVERVLVRWRYHGGERRAVRTELWCVVVVLALREGLRFYPAGRYERQRLHDVGVRPVSAVCSRGEQHAADVGRPR